MPKQQQQKTHTSTKAAERAIIILNTLDDITAGDLPALKVALSIARQPGRTAKDLVEEFGFDKSRISKLIHKLRASGLVRVNVQGLSRPLQPTSKLKEHIKELVDS